MLQNITTRLGRGYNLFAVVFAVALTAAVKRPHEPSMRKGSIRPCGGLEMSKIKISSPLTTGVDSGRIPACF